MGAAVSYGWTKFQQYWKDFIVLVIVVFLVTVAVQAISWLALLPAINGDDTGFVLGWIGYSLAMLLTMAVSFIVQAGVYRAGLEVTRGQAPELGMLVRTDNLVPYILTVLLVAVGAFVGFILCVIPGIIWLFFTAFAPLYALDKGMSPVDAIKASIDVVKNNLGQVFLILLVSYLVYLAGAIVCYVGLLVSIPVALVAITYTYRALNQEPVSP